jgi:hypothetical protein
MKHLNVFIALVVILCGAAASESALAWRGGHARFGVFIGPGWYPPYYGYPPYYYPPYYPPVVVAPAAPTTYIEQGVAQAAPALPTGYWYFCDDAKAYYPYVKECPGGWQRVSPQPAN